MGAQTLLVSLIVTAASTGLLLVLPLVAGRWGRGETSAPTLAGIGRPRALLWAVYFAGVGLGYIMVGSALAGRWTGGGALPRTLAGLCAALLVCALVLPWLLDTTLGAATPARLAVAVGVAAPLGLLMGMPFPTGLRRAGGEANGLVPWAWAVNGGASVLGSTLAVLVSMSYGFTWSFLTGTAAYVVALGVALGMTRRD